MEKYDDELVAISDQIRNLVYKAADLSNSALTTCYDAFVNFSPCIYEGAILCKECSKENDCDMKAGRELHEMYFFKGYFEGKAT